MSRNKFVDNLPLDGEVHLKDDVRVYIYGGHLLGNPEQCAVKVKGETSYKWVDRSKLTPVKDS